MLAGEARVLLQSYLFAQVAMSLDQFVAVYFPFKHRKVAPKMKKIMLAVSMSMIAAVSSHAVLARLTNVGNSRAWYIFGFLVYLLELGLSFLTLLILYPMVVLKLYGQHRKVGPKANGLGRVVSMTNRLTGQRTATVQLPKKELLQVPQEARNPRIEAKNELEAIGERQPKNTAGSAESAKPKDTPGSAESAKPKDTAGSAESARRTTGAANLGTGREPPRSGTNLSGKDQEKMQSKATRKMHVQAIKIYASIFLFFTLSLVALLIVTWSNNPSWSYLYFLNHTGNPVIYYVFAPKFREKVNTFCGRFKCW